MGKRTLILLLILLVATPARAELARQPLTPTALLNRCYTHLTQKKLPPNSPLLTQVQSGASPVDLCMTVFDSATLQSSGPTEGQLVSNTPQAQDVLETFHGIHQAWFPNDDLFTSSEICSDYCVKVAEVHDSAEARLHIARTVFTPGVKYSEVVTGTSGMEALRTNGVRPNISQPINQRFNDTPGVPPAPPAPLNFDLVQLGTLIGMRRIAVNSSKANTSVHAYVLPTGANDHSNRNLLSVPLHQNFGGGVLGSQSYLLLNLGLKDENVTTDGGLVMPRRWAKAVFHDLLCRDVPVIRLADAAVYVQGTTTASTPPFRAGQSCMQCHASMDPMASSARNLAYVRSDTHGDYVIENKFPFIYGHPANLSKEIGTVDQDSNFYTRPTNGRLVMRDFYGNNVNQAVTSLAALGTAISNLDDYYVCAASRYFQYFTGVTVKLSDPGDPLTPAPTATETYYRNLVVQMGLALKNDPTQSIRNLIKSILQSEVYQRYSQRGTPN